MQNNVVYGSNQLSEEDFVQAVEATDMLLLNSGMRTTSVLLGSMSGSTDHLRPRSE